ncbi:hypothetical protein [Novacetimonas maltaceti]|uniref:hypothetical protein n=1 Tax=Novacetimonas maltaceti TaxID=1203393 RepID=UPI00142DD247|nr:hypothetical protein [Novacetimonas maltaceti]
MKLFEKSFTKNFDQLRARVLPGGMEAPAVRAGVFFGWKFLGAGFFQKGGVL